MKHTHQCILSLLLVLVMTLVLLPTGALAAQGLEVDENGFGVNEDGVLLRYDGPGGDIVIPDGVTAIDNDAFRENTAITSVVIPDSVTTLEGSHAFYRCTNLRRVQFENGVTEIPEYTFHECPSLTEVVIPDSVIKIGVNAFSDCTALERVEIPASVECIEEGAFADCPALREVVLSEGLTAIDRAVFIRCAALKRIEIPASVTRIGNVAFMSCASLKEVVFHDGVTEIGESAFESCTSLERADIPASVEKIGRGAFSHCTSLKNVNIANPDADVDSYTFYASSLKSYIQGGAVKRLGGDGTVNTSELTEDERQAEISRYQDSYAYQKSLNTNSTFLAEHIEERDYIYTIVTDAVQRQSDEICTGLTSDADKVAAIHDWMTANIYYDYPLMAQDHPWPTAQTVLDRRAYVCSGYTTLFQALCWAQKIPCVCVSGSTNSGFHAWNAVQVDGAWSWVDVTWDTSNGYYGGDNWEAGTRRNNYFRCSSEFLSIDHTVSYTSVHISWSGGGKTTTYRWCFTVNGLNANLPDQKAKETNETISQMNQKLKEERAPEEKERFDQEAKEASETISQMNEKRKEERAPEEKERFNQELNDHVSPWARSEVAAAYETGLYSGSMRTNFQEQYTRPITRAEFCALVVDLVELAEGGDFTNGIEGISIGDYLASKGLTYIKFKSQAFPFKDIKSYTLGSTSSIPQAYSMGIIYGTSETTFSPNDYLTREQAATMLMRAGRLLGLTTGSDPIRFRDNDQIGDWAKEGVDFVTSHGIMSGVGDNTFDPQGRYTREQALVTIVRMYDAVKEKI